MKKEDKYADIERVTKNLWVGQKPGTHMWNYIMKDSLTETSRKMSTWVKCMCRISWPGECKKKLNEREMLEKKRREEA